MDRRRDEGGVVQPVLAPLAVGDKLPLKLGGDGQPQWLLVIEVLGPDRYVVQYPNSATGVLDDST